VRVEKSETSRRFFLAAGALATFFSSGVEGQEGGVLTWLGGHSFSPLQFPEKTKK